SISLPCRVSLRGSAGGTAGAAVASGPAVAWVAVVLSFSAESSWRWASLDSTYCILAGSAALTLNPRPENDRGRRLTCACSLTRRRVPFVARIASIYRPPALPARDSAPGARPRGRLSLRGHRP